MKTAVTILAAFLGLFSTAAHADLRAGADVTNITPLPEHFPISTAGSMRAQFYENTEEQIHCRTIMIGNAETLVSFTIVDSCLVPREICDSAKRLAGAEIDVPTINMNIAASHTETAKS